MKVDKENLMDRSWDKEAKYDQIRKKVVKKGHGLLTSIQDDLGEDKYTISSKRRFEKVAGIDIKNQDTMGCSGRNKRTKKIDGNSDKKHINKRVVKDITTSKSCDVECRSGCDVIDSDRHLENEAESRYVRVHNTIHEDLDEGSTLGEVDTTVRIAAAHTDNLKTDTNYKKEKRNINALLQNDRELSTTVEKKRKKDVIKGSARLRKSFSTANQDKIISLHNRWGHPSIEKMMQGIKNGSVIGAGITYEDIKNFEMPFCEACLKGRMKKDPTPSSITDKSNVDCLEIICSDIKGPFPKRSTYHNKWFILFICAKSKHMTVYFMKDKTEALDKLKLYKKE